MREVWAGQVAHAECNAFHALVVVHYCFVAHFKRKKPLDGKSDNGLIGQRIRNSNGGKP